MLRACLAVLVVLAIGLGLFSTLQVAKADSGDTVTTVLQPGLNLAGWTEAEASVEAIFDAIPQLEAVYAWDAESQRFGVAFGTDSGLLGDLDTLTPGMGLWLWLGGDAPFNWTRPLVPQTGLAPLHEGWNLVVWAGDDGIATSDALQEIDDLASEAVDSNGEPLVTLTTGSPFWLKVPAAKQWWQLDEPPQIEFASDYSPEEQQELRGQVDAVVAYFARRFGFGIPGLTVRFGDDSIDACGHYAHPAVVLKSYCSGALAHEYAHALQRYLVDLGRPPDTGLGFPNPAWLVEGGANRWAGQYFAASGGYSYEARVTETVGLAARQVTAPLRSAEEHPLDYRLAEFAVDWLTTQAGEDSLYDYYARRAAHRTWQDAFPAILGITALDFYEQFETYRAKVAPPFPRIGGIVLGPDGAPQERVTVRADSRSGAGSSSRFTNAEGRFEWGVEAGVHDLSLSAEGCALEWSSPDERLEPTDAGRATFVLDADGLMELVLNLSAATSEQCSRIEGVVLGPDGAPQEGVTARIHNQAEGWSRVRRTDAEGRFEWTIAGGSYDLSLSTDGCALEWSSPDKRLAPIDAERASFVLDAAVTGLNLNLSTALSEQCSRFEGSVLGPGGAPQQGVWVLIRDLSTGTGRYLGTNAQGTFDARVDTEGSYEVSVILRGCPLQWSSSDGRLEYPAANRAHFSAGADLVGLVFNLPAAASELCRSVEGVVLGPGGAPVEGITITVADVSDGESRSAVTREDGKFEWTLESGSYELWLSSEDCSLDWSTLGDKLEKITGSRARLELDDTAPTGLVILLAALPSELCPGIRGVVTGPDGAPQQSVAVRLRNLSTGTNRTQETDAEGAFGWSVDNGSSYEISLSSNGCPLRWSSADSRLQTATRNGASFTADPDGFTGLVLRLPATASEQCARIEGVVLGPDGGPQVGLIVRLHDQLEAGSSARLTNEEGRFEWTLETGSYELSLSTGACALEWSSTDGRLEPTSAERARFLLDAAGLTGLVLHLSEALAAQCSRIEGSVFGPDGAPQEGVTVRVRSQSEAWSSARLTDADGSFDWTVESGSYELELSIGGCSLEWSSTDGRLEPTSAERARFLLDAAGLTGLVLHLSEALAEQCARIEGVVLGPDGAPQVGLIVRVHNQSAAGSSARFTNQEGYFEWTLESGSYEFELSIGGCSLEWSSTNGRLEPTSAERARFLLDAAGLTGLVLHLSEALSEQCSRIEGVVLGPDGALQDGVWVLVRDLSTGRGRYLGANAQGTFDARVDTDASYEVSLFLRGCPLQWSSSDSRLEYPAASRARFDAGADLVGLVFTLPAAASEQCLQLEGVVLGPQGVPVEGVTVLVRDVSGGDTKSLVTTDDGKFEGTLEDGSYDLLLFSGGCSLEWSSPDSRLDFATAHRARLSLDADTAGVVLNVPTALSEQCRWIEGLVTDLAGNPRAGVSVYSLTSALDGDGRAVNPVPRDVTGSDGRFAIRVPEGHHRVSVRAESAVGYYARGRGFTDYRPNATLVAAGDADVSGITIRYGVIDGVIHGLDGQQGLRIGLREGNSTHYRSATPEFQFLAPRGTFWMGVYCSDFGVVGWYDRANGLVSDRRQATPIVMDDADISLSLELPAGVTCR